MKDPKLLAQARCQYCNELIVVSVEDGTPKMHLACPAGLSALEADIKRNREKELDEGR